MLSRYVASQVKQNGYFLMGLMAGLYVALVFVPLDDRDGLAPAAPTAACGAEALGALDAATDDYEPQRSEPRAPPPAEAPSPARSLQRPRYYSTELGIRDKLFVAVLSSEAALAERAPALNRTAAHLLPALKFFMTASALQAHATLANVVGFTDTREMLKPFHVLKYVADNYLDEYDYFFLVGDGGFLNARRLLQLVGRLSVSTDVYMGVTDDDTHYCSLERGVLLSNSVLRRVHGALDWCVRNSYSPHHHENLGRCVLHTTQLYCVHTLQGERFVSVQVPDAADESLKPELADAVTAHPVPRTRDLHRMHAYVSRVYLDRGQREAAELRAALARLVSRHPPAFRNATWPGGLRSDAGLAPPPPDTRFDHARWTPFNATHALMPDDHRAAAPLAPHHRRALHTVLEAAWAWAEGAWGGLAPAGLVEGAWRWTPAQALSYRLLLRLARADGSHELRQLEVVRPVGRARLVALPYVTESTRVALLLPVLRWLRADLVDALDFLRHYEATCLKRDRKTSLLVALADAAGAVDEPDAPAAADELRRTLALLRLQYQEARIDTAELRLPADDATRKELAELRSEAVRSRAARAALARLPRDALVLLAVPHMDYNEDFLNRVRMNTIAGVQAFAPVPFARFAQYDHPRFVDASGNKPTVNTGRFHGAGTTLLSFYRRDYDDAVAAADGSQSEGVLETLLRGGAVHVLRAPEPGMVLRARPQPCPAAAEPCLRHLQRDRFEELNLGARHSLAKLLLEAA